MLRPPVHPDHTDVGIFQEFLRVPTGRESGSHDGVFGEVVVPVRLEPLALNPDPVIDDLYQAISLGLEILRLKGDYPSSPFWLPIIDIDWVLGPIPE